MDNVRLVGSAHNAYAAERVFGTEFMDHKRQQARERPRAAKAQRAAAALARASRRERRAAEWARPKGTPIAADSERTDALIASGGSSQ